MSSKTDEFRATINEAYDKLSASSLWRHYKGGVYFISEISIDTDTLEARVQYVRRDGPEFDAGKELGIVFSRKLSEWFDMIEVEGLGAPMMVQRFVPVAPFNVTQYKEITDEC